MIAFAIKILTDPVFPLVTLLLGFLIGNRLAMGRDRRNDFNQATKDFISAFQDELTKLKLNCPAISIYEIIYPAREKHHRAYSIFSHYFRWCKLKRFRQAWREYYVLTPTHPNKEQDKDDDIILLVDKIKVLLDFAKFK